MERYNIRLTLRRAIGITLLCGGLLHVGASGQADESSEEDVFQLNPFVVEGDADIGYQAEYTLGGTRIRSELDDLGSSIQVITADFLADTGATDNRSLLQYTTNTEVGGVDGNFTGAGNGVGVYESFGNPSHTTRVRGLAAADNTRNFFLTDMPWDNYNVERVDIQRGPNAILFGFGSPAGIINTGLIRPQMGNSGKVQLRTDANGSARLNFDFNREVISGELAVRLAGLHEEEKYRQDPAYEDDQRFWAGAEWRPNFMNGKQHQTSLSVSFEDGEIEANRPRSITPMDRFSAWFRPVRTVEGNLTSEFNPAGGVGRQFFTPTQLHNDRIPATPNAGQTRSTYENGEENPYYIPALGSFGFVYGGPAGFVTDPSSGVIQSAQVLQFRERNGLGPDGAVDGKIDGNYYAAPGGIDAYSYFAIRAGLPLAEFGQYKQSTIQDRSIFDFYNHLLDGPNKEEGQSFDHINFSIRQTFFQNRFGFELARDVQNYFQYGSSLLVDDRQAIMIDVNETYTDGTPNPNVGRPFITDSGQFGNWGYTRRRTADRFTAFFENNFEDHTENALSRFLGRQSFTFLYSGESARTRNFNWQRHTMGPDFREFIQTPSIVDNFNAFSPVIYLGPSMAEASGPSGLRLPALKTRIQIPDTVSVRIWDDNWNAPEVDPGSPWLHPGGYSSTQSENPANYVGWTNRTFSIEKATPFSPDNLARAGSLSMDTISSTALVLQNHFWGGALVGTYGWRRDVAKAYIDNALLDPVTNRAQLEDMRLPDRPNNQLESQTNSWSAVLHLNELSWLEDRLPLNVSLYYNESSNFQPAAGRIDVFGRSLTPPSGKTTDRSILLETKDGRYRLSVTRYSTAMENASGDYIIGQWFLGYVQAWGENWKNIFELDNNRGTIGQRSIFNTYAPKTGQTQVEANALEAAAIEGWKAHVANLRALSEELTGNPDAFDTAFQIDRSNLAYTGITASDPAGLTFTQDTLSEGWEFEFSARPTDNWDLTLNASKVDAVRENIGGEALTRYVQLVNDDLNNTPAGDLRIYGGWASAPTILEEWNSIFNGNYQLQRLLEGTPVPEIRKWRFNLVTNYHFTDGRLRGVNIGGGYRWQDKVVIGFPADYANADKTEVAYDLSNPYYGPSEGDVDLWIGYYRRLWDSVDWHIQLNVRNAFADKSLIPINTQPDGTVATWRLGSATMWSLTSTFTF